MDTQNTETETARIILQQMGGPSRISAMTGARHFMTEPNAVSFKFPNRGGRKVPNYVRVVLDPSDTYTVEFGRCFKRRGVPEYVQLATFTDVYCDMLIELFEGQTGLYLHM